MNALTLSNLSKTWILDLDGTLVKHNGYKNGEDILLEGVKEFFESIMPNDRVILLTSRSIKTRERTVRFLHQQGIKYDAILFEMPMGERILVNDKKPSGLNMAFAINKERDGKFSLPYVNDDSL